MTKAVVIDNETAVVVPTKLGNESAPSGLACLVIVARHHGMHLSVPQLIHENVLPSREVTDAEIVQCAQKAGLKAELVKLGGPGLAELKKALPAIVTLKNGSRMVLLK